MNRVYPNTHANTITVWTGFAWVILDATQDDEYIILGFLSFYIVDGKGWKEGYESNREKENPSLFFVLFFFPFSFIYYVVESIILSIRK